MHDPDDIGDLVRDVARRLSLTRRALGLSQIEFGRRAGLSQSRYNQYETAERLLSLKAAIAISDAYGVSLDWLFRGDNNSLQHRDVTRIEAIRAEDRARR